MNWFDDDLAQESARGDDGFLYTVYMTSPLHKWTVTRTMPGGPLGWCGRYFPSRAEAKAAAPVATYWPSSIPEPELNEALVRVLEKDQKAAGA